MADIDSSNLCKPHAQYVSQTEVAKASKARSLGLRRSTSFSTESTFVHFLVQVQLHSGAVQISINPFTVVEFPGQIFFSCQFRYTICCARAPSSLGQTIKERVQQVYDAFYRLGPWDFAKEECYTVDSTGSPCKISKASCLIEAQKRLRGYFNHAGKSQPPGIATQSHEQSRIDEAMSKIKRGLEILQDHKYNVSPNGKPHEAKSTTKRKTDEYELVDKRSKITERDPNIEPDLTHGPNEGKHTPPPELAQEMMFSWERDIESFFKEPNQYKGYSLPSSAETGLFTDEEIFNSGHNLTPFDYTLDSINDERGPPLSSST